jgi:hypothetical protein
MQMVRRAVLNHGTHQRSHQILLAWAFLVGAWYLVVGLAAGVLA